MYELVKVKKFDLVRYKCVSSILNACGKDMAKKYNLHHWDNSKLKSFAIVFYCSLKNDIYLLYFGDKPVATFMVKLCGKILHFEKLGTLPSESGKGIGSFCINSIEAIASKEGCNKVVMEVYKPSQHAILFYTHKGYTVTGCTDTLKYEELKMEKEI